MYGAVQGTSSNNGILSKWAISCIFVYKLVKNGQRTVKANAIFCDGPFVWLQTKIKENTANLSGTN